MDERSGLKRLGARFPGHFAGGELAQFVIDQRQKLAGGPGVAWRHGVEDFRQLAHR